MLFEFIAALVKIVVILFGIIFAFAALLTWVERKQSAIMQDRIGANRASILGFRLWGLINIIADTLKSFFKEDFVPPFGNRVLHHIAPFVGIFAAMLAYAVIPFAPPLELFGHTIPMQVADLNVGVLYLMAFGSLGVWGAILAGWSSNNTYAQLGAVRGVAQMLSYEVIIGLTILGVILCMGAVRPSEMVAWQGHHWFGVIPRWGILVQPLGFVLYFWAMIAETRRIPFDLPEGESEILGYNLEYSGLKFGIFLIGEFVEIVVLSALLATLFFGGWQLPWLHDAGLTFGGNLVLALPYWLVWVLRFGGFVAKIVFFCWVQMLVRWTLPRFRIDQLLRLGWQYMLPLALVNLVLTALLTLLW